MKKQEDENREKEIAKWIHAGVDEAQAIRLVDKTTDTLDINSHSLNHQKIIELTFLLRTNTTISKLSCLRNNVNDGGAVAFADMLKINKTIREINFTDNYITSQGAVAIAEMLEVNTTITIVYLGMNKIDSEGAVRLAEALKINTHVTKLYLGFNHIGTTGAKALIEMLEVNKTLTNLKLGERNTSYETTHDLYKSVLKALIVNKYITCIDLGFRTPPELKPHLQYNKNLAAKSDKLAKIVKNSDSSFKLLGIDVLKFYAKESDEILLKRSLEKLGCKNIDMIIKSFNDHVAENFLVINEICKSINYGKFPLGKDYLSQLPGVIIGSIGAFLGNDVNTDIDLVTTTLAGEVSSMDVEESGGL